MKLIATEMITLDGVYQGPGGPDEDRRGGFDRGGWAGSHADAETGRHITSLLERADALLLGRRTFQIWEPYWPAHDDNPIGHTINAHSQVRALDHANQLAVGQHPLPERRRGGRGAPAQGAAGA